MKINPRVSPKKNGMLFIAFDRQFRQRITNYWTKTEEYSRLCLLIDLFCHQCWQRWLSWRTKSTTDNKREFLLFLSDKTHRNDCRIAIARGLPVVWPALSVIAAVVKLIKWGLNLIWLETTAANEKRMSGQWDRRPVCGHRAQYWVSFWLNSLSKAKMFDMKLRCISCFISRL